MTIYHRHHIVPRFAGGTDDSDNIAILTVHEHADAHEARWKEHGDHRDFWAMTVLRSPNMTDEELVRLRCVQGGLVQGRANAESGHMREIQKLSPKKGSADICRERQVNAFFDPELRTEICRKGGIAQGNNNVESGHIDRLAESNKKTYLYDGRKYRGRKELADAIGIRPNSISKLINRGEVTICP